MHSASTCRQWTAFAGIVAVLLTLDLEVFHRRARWLKLHPEAAKT